MGHVIVYDLPSGAKVEFEVAGTGMSESRNFSAGGSIGARVASCTLEAALAPLKEAMEVVARGLDGLKALGPDKVEVEMSAELSTGSVVKVLLGEGKGGIKVKLAWDFGKK